MGDWIRQMELNFRKRKIKQSNFQPYSRTNKTKAEISSVNNLGDGDLDDLSFDDHNDNTIRYEERVIATGCCLPWKLVFEERNTKGQKQKQSKQSKSRYNRQSNLRDQDARGVHDDEESKTIVNLDLVSLARMN